MGIKTHWLLFAWVGLFAGCAAAPNSPYVAGFHYGPEPALAVMFKQGTQTPTLSVLVSVVGLRRGNDESGIPASMEVRMRFENKGQVAVSFDPRSASLVTGALQPFDPPIAHPPGTIQIAPGQTLGATLYFPFPAATPPRSMTLDSLRLRWQVQIESQSYLQTAYFERASPLYYEAE